MDIFDLSLEEFEKEVEYILDSITEDELVEELIDNGLIIDEYETNEYYINDNFDNVWVHKTKTSNMAKLFSSKKSKKITSSILEAA